MKMKSWTLSKIFSILKQNNVDVKEIGCWTLSKIFSILKRIYLNFKNFLVGHYQKSSVS